MSSNIRLQRNCMYCGQVFTAKTTTTKYCSHTCNSRHYKSLQREKKIIAAIPTKVVPNTSTQTIKEYMSMNEAAGLLGVHVRTVMNLISSKKLACSRVGKRVIIGKSDLTKMLHNEKC